MLQRRNFVCNRRGRSVRSITYGRMEHDDLRQSVLAMSPGAEPEECAMRQAPDRNKPNFRSLFHDYDQVV
jgi:hypothetical protein